MSRQKYQKPLHVEGDFEEVLERLSGVDPKEVQEAIAKDIDQQRGSTMLELRGTRVSEDENGNICLNDLWQMVGSPPNTRPTDWHRHKRTLALEAALRARIVEKLHHSGKSGEAPDTFVSGKGRGSKSFAHPVLALDYAELLEPALGVEIREAFLRYRANDISLANDILDRIAEQVQEDEFRVKNRSEITVRNVELAKQGARAGCTTYATQNCTTLATGASTMALRLLTSTG